MTKPTRQQMLLAWYAAHPGWHRCSEVAQVTGLTTHTVAVLSRRLSDTEQIQRLQTSTHPYTPSLYGMPVAPSKTRVARGNPKPVTPTPESEDKNDA